MPASVTIIPEKECPTRTVGPSCRAKTRCAESTAAGSVVRGFCTAVALSPTACNLAITSDQHDPSANSPCTRTMLLAFVGTRFAPRARVEIVETTAAAAMAVVKLRLFIVIICLPCVADYLLPSEFRMDQSWRSRAIAETARPG